MLPYYIDGMEKLSEKHIYESVTYYTSLSIASFILGILCLLGILYLVIIYLPKHQSVKSPVKASIAAAVSISLCLLMIICSACNAENTKIIDDYMQYKVSINYEASFIEVFEHYEILDVEGDIYTVKEKVNDNH